MGVSERKTGLRKMTPPSRSLSAPSVASRTEGIMRCVGAVCGSSCGRREEWRTLTAGGVVWGVSWMEKEVMVMVMVTMTMMMTMTMRESISIDEAE